jgi:hypothetical protein
MPPITAIEPAAVDPAHRPDLKAAIEAMPASRLLGLQVAGFDPAGVSRIELPVRPELTFDGRWTLVCVATTTCKPFEFARASP